MKQQRKQAKRAAEQFKQVAQCRCYGRLHGTGNAASGSHHVRKAR